MVTERRRKRLLIWLFIFKRIKYLHTGKLLSIREILCSEFSSGDSSYTFKEYNVLPIENSSEDIKSFAVEVEKEMNFFVTNYPNFGKDSNENVSLYTIEGISEHAYLSGFKRISRGYNNPTSTEIRNILILFLKLQK